MSVVFVKEADRIFLRGCTMFVFDNASGGTIVTAILAWLVVFAALFCLNEVTRRFKWIGFAAFVILPIVLTVMWFTVLGDTAYKDWFHLAKVYSSTAGCIIFWCIRFVGGTRKDGSKWRLADKKAFLFLAPLILAINIAEACARDFQVGGMALTVPTAVDGLKVISGPWNYMNAVAGILNMLTITGWWGITIRKKTPKDGSRDMIWPDMLWFWIIAYDLWNFTYTYNCIPAHSWYAGLALLLAPTLCAFTVGKGAWLQHRAQTLALWCMFAQTFPSFQDQGKFFVESSFNPTVYTVLGAIALISNVLVFAYMLYRVAKLKKNPYTNDIYTDLKQYKEIKELAE